MADGRRQTLGELAAWHVSMILARMPWTAVALDPRAINPYREQSPAKSTALEDLERWQAKQMWNAMYGTKNKRG